MSLRHAPVRPLVVLLGTTFLLSCGGGDGGGTDPDPDDQIQSVSVSPTSATVDVGETQQLQATARNGRGEPVSTGIAWSSSDDSRATVSGSGLVTGVSEGPVTITASASGVSGSASLTVNDPDPPADPSGLQVTSVSDTEIRLDWNDNASNEDEWIVERESGGGGSVAGGPLAVFQAVTTLGPNSTTYTDSGLDPAASYRYRVQACNENGCSSFTSEVEGETHETLVVETTSLPSGAQNVVYEQTLAASGGDGPPTWDLAAGALPDGLSLNAAGEITGTPTVAGVFDFTVRASGAGQTPTQELSLEITENILAPTVTTLALPDGGVGAPYAAQLEAAQGDGTYAWAVTGGALPGGVMLGSSGALSGLPTTPGMFSATFEVTSAEMTGDAILDITVHPALSVTTADLPDGIEGEAYMAQLAAAGGDGTTTWSLASGALPPGLTLEADGSIAGTPTAAPPTVPLQAGTATFTVQAESGVGQVATMALSITVFEVLAVTTASLPNGELGAAYGTTLAATGGDGSTTWSITGGALPGGITLNSATGELSGTPTETGSFDLTVRAQSGDGQEAMADLGLVVDPAPVEITTTSLPDGAVDAAYDQQLQATGGDGATYAWTATAGALPDGLALSGGGLISGTATTAGTFDFTVEVTSGGMTDTQDLSITISENIEAPEVSTTSLPDGGVGAAYSAQLMAIKGDGDYAWAVTAGALPTDVSLAGDGSLSGTPTADGTFNATFEVTSAMMTGTKALDIVIHPALSITTTALPDGVDGQAYDAQLVADGGDGSTTWALDGGSLPPGLSLESDGTITGTPTAPPMSPAAVGTSNFTVRAESGVGQVVTRALSITINEVLEITTSSLPDGQIAVAYGETLVATGGDGDNTWSITSGSLPDGLTLDAGSGEISGTPTEAGSFNITVQVESGDGQADSANLTLDVDAAAVVITTTSLPNGTVGVPYSEQLQATGGDGVNYSWSLDSGPLPTGLSVGIGGLVGGTPSAEGTFNFTVEVTSAGQTDTQALSITIDAAPPEPVAIETMFLDVAYDGAVYSSTIATSGGDGSDSFTVSQGSLPTGLSLNGSTGEISGTPSGAGTAHFEIQVESDGQTDTRIYMLTVSGNPASGFNVHLHNVAGVIPSAAVQTQIDAAVAKWEDVITSNLTTLGGNLSSGFCNGYSDDFDGHAFDDVEILLNIASIDGPGMTLAAAGPCYATTRDGFVLPLLGWATFDSADLGGMDATQLRAVIFHELGHIMGIGTLWELNGWLKDKGMTDPRYTGTSGVAQYTLLGGADPDIPVANTGGGGTRDAHWRESTFNTEIMTGYSEGNGVAQPISTMTVGSLADLGWSVDLGAAEAYTIPGPPPPLAPPPEDRPALDDIYRGPVAILLPDGTVETIYLRSAGGGQ